MRTLSDPQTQARALRDRARAHRRGSSPRWPRRRPSCSRNLDTTFGALANVARPFLQDSITGGPPALDEAIKDFPQQRPFLANSEALFRELRPGVAALATAAPDLADALEIGTPTLRRSVAFNNSLKPAFEALERFADDPLVTLGVTDLKSTVTILSPTIAHLAPVQTVCNYATLWFRNVSSLLSVGDANGTSQRFIIIATPQGPNNEGGPSSAPANGGVPGQKDNYLHTNPYPNTASPGQPKECEAGNEPFIVGKQEIGNAARDPVRQDRDDEAAAVMPGRRDRADDERVPRKDRMGASPVVVGVVVLVIACIGVFFGFTKHVPFTHGFRVKAVFESSNSIRKNSPVRIAGVNVGKVVKVEGKPGSDAAVVTMDVTKQGPADPQGRHLQDPPADLPGGQLLRRRHARHAVGADHRRRRHDPDHPDGDAGAARPGAERAAERHADQPAEDRWTGWGPA